MGLFSFFGSKDASMKDLKDTEMLIKHLGKQDTLGLTILKDESLLDQVEPYCISNQISISCFISGLIYFYGVNIKPNPIKAEKLLIKFTDTNHPLTAKAYFYLSILERDYKGNQKKEAEYLIKAHDLGLMDATTELAYYYFTGDNMHITRNKQTARLLWQKAVDAGDYRMQENIDMIDNP